MKKITPILSLFSLVCCIDAVQASPMQYQFTATYSQELNADSTPAPTHLFAAGTSITTTFAFDSSTPVTQTNLTSIGFQQFGLYSYYSGSLSNISGAVAGYSFSANSGSTVVANSNPGDPTFFDGVFNQIGETGSGFSGFSIDNFNLIGVVAYSVGVNNYLPNQSLPATLTNGPVNTGVNLIFENVEHARHTVTFWGGAVTQVASVPEPSSVALLGAGLIGMLTFNRRRVR